MMDDKDEKAQVIIIKLSNLFLVQINNHLQQLRLDFCAEIAFVLIIFSSNWVSA